MARQSKNNGSGNDGSWFLEAVGAVPEAPTPSETVASLQLDNTLTEMQPAMSAVGSEVVFSSFDGSTGTSTSAFERPVALPDLQARGVLVGEADEIVPTPPPPEIEPPNDTELSPVLRTRRSFRWPVVAIGLLIVATSAVAAFWLPTALRQEAVGLKQSYADASLALRVELPNSQAALDTVTDPLSTPNQLSATVPAISQLDSVAHALAVTAAEPLPRQIPIFAADEVAELGALHDAAQINAAQGSDIARSLGHAYVYRTTIPQLLTTGDLPSSADTETINALSVSLASSLVNDSNALNNLPTTEATADLNDAAHAAVERFAFWQEEYLDSLAEDDEDAAALLITELEDLRTTLDEMIFSSLGVARVEIDQQIVELAAALETYVDVLTR